MDAALFLSEKLGSKITAIHVIENVPTGYIQSQKVLDELLEARKNESQKILDECSSIATKKGIVITTTLLKGNPASIILEFSQSEKYEVIIIGSRGMGQFKELIQARSFIIHHVQSCLSDEFNRIPCRSIHNKLNCLHFTCKTQVNRDFIS